MRKPQVPPPLADLLASEDLREVLELAAKHGSEPMGEYLHWDKLRFKAHQEGISPRLLWAGVKQARVLSARPLPFRSTSGQEFSYVSSASVQRMLHEIDKNSGGTIAIDAELNPDDQPKYLVKSLIDEAITSSQLEGAATTRRVAKEMIRTGRSPRDESEQMIYNNYEAMEFIHSARTLPLSPDLILEIHRILCQKTFRGEKDVGRYRQTDDVFVMDRSNSEVLHVPPGHVELPQRIAALCKFANEQSRSQFTHPVVRAIVLHFMLAYEHPFVDGNGRVARALFYWAMLNQGYWLWQFVSISSVIKRAPSRYAMAYLHTETDGGDTTYFLLYHLTVLQRSIRELGEYISKSTATMDETRALLREYSSLNHRQIALLDHALRHPGHRYTIAGQARSHRVVYQTARTDLLQLAKTGLLEQRKQGNKYVFYAPRELQELVKSRAATGR